MAMTNAEWMIKNGYKFSDITVTHKSAVESHTYIFYLKQKKMCELELEDVYLNQNAVLVWLDMEHVDPILDDAEKQYLSAVIKPFRDRVKYIAKIFAGVGDHADCYIFVKFTDASHDMDFPIFGGRDMYKGMKPYDKYTLEELGL